MADRSTKAPLTDGEVRATFRALSDEHIQERRRDDREASWRRIENRLESKRLRMVPQVAARWPWRSFEPRRVMALAAVAALTFGFFAAWLYRSPGFSGHELTFVVEGMNAPAQGVTAQGVTAPGVAAPGVAAGQVATDEGQLIATEDRPAALVFSDESRIELRPYTTLRVHVEGGSRVVTRLARGELLVHVVHHAETDYRFQAGAYEVRVVGTEFSLAYEPVSERFDVSMSEGRVAIVDASRRQRFLSAGESLRLPEKVADAAAQRLEAPAPSTVGAVPTKPDSAPPVPDAAGVAEPKTATAESYRSLAAAGRFQQIVAAAKATGLENVFQNKPASELQELAQAARYTGELALAERTWKELQVNYRSQDAGQNASFFLGRLAEQRGRQGEALRHYDVYLTSAPRGVFATEALGRKMLLVQATQGGAAARPIAAEYLKRFPSGAYGGAARALVND